MIVPAIKRGIVVDIGGVHHVLWGVRGVGKSVFITYCNTPIERGDSRLLEVGSDITCVACIAVRAHTLATKYLDEGGHPWKPGL